MNFQSQASISQSNEIKHFSSPLLDQKRGATLKGNSRDESWLRSGGVASNEIYFPTIKGREFET